MKIKSCILILITIFTLSKVNTFAEGSHIKNIDKTTSSKDMEVALNWVESKLSVRLYIEAHSEDIKNWFAASDDPHVLDIGEIITIDTENIISDNAKVKNNKLSFELMTKVIN